MPIHDWTRVTAGTWHAFHLSWTSEIQEALNSGLLPPSYYAQAEQIVGPLGFHVASRPADDCFVVNAAPHPSADDLLTAPPPARVTASAEMDDYVLKRRTVVIRHASDDRIIALLEIVSPGNKSSRHGLKAFVEKAVEALYRGFHLLVIDLFPPGPRDPQGIHGAVRGEISDDPFALPPGEPLTLAAYSAGPVKRAYVEPTAVGRELIDRPLFLDPDGYVNVPLEPTYRAAYRGVPRKWKAVLDA